MAGKLKKTLGAATLAATLAVTTPQANAETGQDRRARYEQDVQSTIDITKTMLENCDLDNSGAINTRADYDEGKSTIYGVQSEKRCQSDYDSAEKRAKLNKLNEQGQEMLDVMRAEARISD